MGQRQSLCAMPDNRQPPGESASNRLAAFLRDCILLLIVLAMIGWLVYFAVKAIKTGHLDLGHGVRPSRRWFTRPLDGLPAVLAGFAFLCLAGAFASLCTSHPLVSRIRLPAWIRSCYWWFFAGFLILYLTARFISN